MTDGCPCRACTQKPGARHYMFHDNVRDLTPAQRAAELDALTAAEPATTPHIAEARRARVEALLAETVRVEAIDQQAVRDLFARKTPPAPLPRKITLEPLHNSARTSRLRKFNR